MNAEAAGKINFRCLWRYIGLALPYWWNFLLGAAGGMGRQVHGLYVPWMMAYLIDAVGTPYLKGMLKTSEVWSRTGWVMVLFADLLVFHVLMTMARFYFPYQGSGSVSRDLRKDLFAHLQGLSLAFHTQRPAGAQVARVMADVDAAQGIYDSLFIQLTQQLFTGVWVAVALLLKDWQWAVVVLIATPAFAMVARSIGKPLRLATRMYRQSFEGASAQAQERLAMVREVQAFTAENREEESIRGRFDALRKWTVRLGLLGGGFLGASEIARFLGTALVIAFGIYGIVHHRPGVTAGSLWLFVTYTDKLLFPIEYFADLYTRLQTAAAPADRIFEFLDTPPAIRDLPGAHKLEPQGALPVQFDAVSFAYPSKPSVMVLREVSFSVPAGARVVMVGESGAGKSTLASLLPRFYDVLTGRILIDGQDLRHFQLKSLRQALGIVPQDPVLFAGTIADNIRYGRPEASLEEVRQAIRDANAEQFVLEMEHGLESQIGERGVGLSGGQIQRLAIARAFLKNPPLLILDEPTSNLDASSESQIMEALERLSRGRTTFVIAHRLSLGRDADMIISLDRGRLAEIGTHEDLLARDGVYRHLWLQQMGDVDIPAIEPDAADSSPA
jgi:subfamily B ATP-binding cassette protein MsbA